MYSNYYQYTQLIQQQLRLMEQRLRLLEEENAELKKKVEDIKPLHIENINYKIQELEVKELKGTLNIGMTALSDPEEIKKWIKDADAEGEDIQLHDLEQTADDDDDAGEAHANRSTTAQD